MRVSVRNGAVRGLILAGVAAVAAGAWVASSWVSPERVREQVVAALEEQFHDVDVSVGSARLRLLGGIAVTDLTLTRKGDPPDRPFLVVPAAVLSHDKERLNGGRLVIKRVELDRPVLHLERAADGKWNLEAVRRPGPADRPVPTFVATGATLTVADHTPGGLPPVRLTDARFTLLNDPLPVLTLDAQATAPGLGRVEVKGRLNRINDHAAVSVKLPEVAAGPATQELAARFAPAVAPHLAGLTATAAVEAELSYAPDAVPAWRQGVTVEVKDGRFVHPDLPRPAERIAARVRRAEDGRVTVDGATAAVGPVKLTVSLETLPEAANPERQRGGGRTPSASEGVGDNPLAAARGSPDTSLLGVVEERMRSLSVTAGGVPLDDEVLGHLGDDGAEVKRLFRPAGTADVAYAFTRDAAGGWRREVEVRPNGIGVRYAKFPYPVTDVNGWVRRTSTAGGDRVTGVNLVGTAGGQRVTATGTLTGPGPDPGIDLRVAGANLPLDEALVAALPGPYPALVRQFRAAGRADFVAKVVQKPGVNWCDNEFRVDIRDATVRYDRFPYQFDKVKGQVLVRAGAAEARPGVPTPPAREELVLEQFTGTHGAATVWLSGSKRALPGAGGRKLVLHVGGAGCRVDDDLRAALGGLKMDPVWTALSPRGVLTFAADVEVLDRGPDRPGAPTPPFDPAADLRLTFDFSGPAVTPSFFPYDVTDLSGRLEYRNGRVGLAEVAGRHAGSRVKLAAGEVRFYPDGAVWANLGGLEVKPLVADAALLRAVPGRLRAGVAELNLRGHAELQVHHLVVLTPPDGPGPPPDPLPISPVVGLSPAGGGREPRGAAGNRGLAPPARLDRVRAQTPPPPDPVVYWDAELRLAGAAAEAGVGWDDVYGQVRCVGRYDGTHLGAVVGNLWLDRAVVARQPLAGVQGHARAAPQRPDPARPGYYLPPELEFRNLSAGLFGGTVNGEARVALADPPRYELWLTAADVRLDEVARHYKLGSDADLSGLAQAQLRLTNRPDPKTGRWAADGEGRVDVPAGRMYNLPVLLDLVKVLKLQAPDKTAFEEAHAAFRVAGDRVKIDQLDLIGKAVCVGGSGEVAVSGGYARLELYTLGSQILARLANTPVGDLTAFLSKNLLKHRLTWENGELRYVPEPVPVVTEPARAIVDRLRGRGR